MRPWAARLWEHKGHVEAATNGKGQIQGRYCWKIMFIEAPPAAPSVPDIRLLLPLQSGLS